MTRPIAVFGATGFVGSAVVREGGLAGFEVRPVDRASRTPTADDVLYLISTTHNYHVFDDVHRDVDTNLTVLLDVLKSLKPGRSTFNFVSSWFVYGDTPLPACEDAPCHPRGFYSITKHCAEQLTESYCRTFGIDYRILRVCNVYGPGDTGVGKQKNALQFLIGELRAHRPISLYHDGDFLRDYLHVDDVARALLLCAEQAPKNQVTNIGSGERIVFRQLMERAATLLGSTSDIGTMEPPAFHALVQVKDFYMDTTRLKALGFQPRISLEAGLGEICRP
ncbi:MAG: NAD(P)-dependent oxidoreductase [Myxococcales bacterium]|nr:NAD(P)-dependent oxidoreductase [Myxococcales bacterium]